jgi:transcription initiation factor TFIIIB Brf1 subunit/transcription initiation factor TFIIB
MNELQKIAAEAKRDMKMGEHVCKYCGQGFVRESTLQVHQCEPKRRDQQRSEKGVVIGFQTWLRFHELTQGSAKLKTYTDFCNNNFYNAFVRFGRYCVGISAINVNQFIDYVLKNQIKIDNWCKDKIYEEYLYKLLRTESADDALERSILTMQEWAEQTDNDITAYFTAISSNRFVQHVLNGRVSCWAIYCCDNGIAKLETLSEEQVTLLMPWIDPEFWQRKLHDYPADAELTKHILAQAGF